MGVLQDFERRLEGAVEGFFARAFRSGLQPVELAKAVQRYAEDNRHVATDGVVVPNQYRFSLSPKDLGRLDTYGSQLTDELGEVVERTAAQEGWLLRGPVTVSIDASESVEFGRYELSGRVVAGPRRQPPAAPPPSAPEPTPTTTSATRASAPPPPAATEAPALRPQAALVTEDGSARLDLAAGRYTLGRLASCDLVLEDPTVSREHAAVVRRGESWWILDLGSTNGTRVNGVQAAEHPLRDGDELELGEVQVVYEEGG